MSGVEPNHLQKLSRIVGNKKKDNVVPQTIASDMFNEYYSNIGSDLIKSMPDPGNLSWEITNASIRCLLNLLKKLRWNYNEISFIG